MDSYEFDKTLKSILEKGERQLPKTPERVDREIEQYLKGKHRKQLFSRILLISAACIVFLCATFVFINIHKNKNSQNFPLVEGNSLEEILMDKEMSQIKEEERKKETIKEKEGDKKNSKTIPIDKSTKEVIQTISRDSLKTHLLNASLEKRTNVLEVDDTNNERKRDIHSDSLSKENKQSSTQDIEQESKNERNTTIKIKFNSPIALVAQTEDKRVTFRNNTFRIKINHSRSIIFTDKLVSTSNKKKSWIRINTKETELSETNEESNVSFGIRFSR